MSRETVYFARHNDEWETDGLVEGSILEHLFRNRHVAVHYDGVRSWDPDDYSGRGGQLAIKYINRLDAAEEPALVVAAYDGVEKVLIGEPVPGSKKFFHEYLPEASPSALPLKMLELRSVEEAELQDFPFPFLLAPPYGTLMRWEQCQDIVRTYYHENELDPRDVNMYLPYQLEVLAEEWLRKKGILQRKVFRLGGGLKKFDIFGIDAESRPVVAQVKHSTSKRTIEAFFEDTTPFSAGHRYFFYEECRDVPSEPHCVKLSHVLEDFDSGEPEFLEKLIHARA